MCKGVCLEDHESMKAHCLLLIKNHESIFDVLDSLSEGIGICVLLISSVIKNDYTDFV